MIEYLENPVITALARKYGKIPGVCHNPVISRNSQKLLYKRPCQNCVACQVRQRNGRAGRCLAEAITTPSLVASLTIDDNHISGTDWYDPELWRNIFDNLQRRLRERTGTKCLLRAVAETGETTGRPHMHAVIHGVPFNQVPLRQLKFQKVDWWKYGTATLDKVHSASVGYVLGYLYDDEKKALQLQRRTSQGIGLDYFRTWCEHMRQGRKKHGCRYTQYPDPKTGLLERPTFEIDHQPIVMDYKLKEIAREYGLVREYDPVQVHREVEFEIDLEISQFGGPLNAQSERNREWRKVEKANAELRAQRELKNRHMVHGVAMYG